MHKLRPGQPFWDTTAPHSAFSANLPDPLRIKPNGVQPLQAAVYEDFGEHMDPRQTNSADAFFGVAGDSKRRMASRPSTTMPYPRNGQITPAMYGPSPGPEAALAQTYLSPEEAMDRFTVRLMLPSWLHAHKVSRAY